MKRIVFLTLATFLYVIGSAQDACYDKYMKALQEYNKGNYIEAQSMFLLVAENCDNYSTRAISKLKECNKKLSDLQIKQTGEIKQLKDEKQKLTTQNEILKSENTKLTSDKSAATGQIQKSNETITKLRRDIENLQKDTSDLQKQIIHLNDTILLLCNDEATNADAQNSTLKALKEATDSIKAVEEEIVKLQTAINQLNQNYEKQVAQNDNRSLNKNPINDLQDAVENLNVTLKKVLTKISKIKSNNGNSGKLSSTNR